MYALSLEADKRIAFATDEEHAKEGMPLVATLPDGNYYDYRYIDNEYIYDPLPQPDPPEPEPGGNYATYDEMAAAIREGINSYAG